MDDESNYRTSAALETCLRLHRDFGVNPEDWHRWVLRRPDLRAGSTVLELGCGTGALWLAADADALRDVELTLCDRSPGMLDAARQALGHLPGIRFELIDLDTEFRLPVVPDVLVCNHDRGVRSRLPERGHRIDRTDMRRVTPDGRARTAPPCTAIVRNRTVP